MGRARRWNHRSDRYRPLALPSRDEAHGRRRFHARMGWDCLAAAQFACCMDGGCSARLCCAPSGRLALPRTGATCRTRERKGNIEVGCDADLVIWNPDAKFVVEPSQLHYRHKITPYAGRALAGVVETTILRGRKIYDRGEFCPSPIGPRSHWIATATLRSSTSSPSLKQHRR